MSTEQHPRSMRHTSSTSSDVHRMEGQLPSGGVQRKKPVMRDQNSRQPRSTQVGRTPPQHHHGHASILPAPVGKPATAAAVHQAVTTTTTASGPPEGGGSVAHVTIQRANGTLWYRNQPYLLPLRRPETGAPSAVAGGTRPRSASAATTRDTANPPSTVNYCRHYLLGQCNRGTMCRFAHLEQHTIVVRQSREGKPLRSHSCHSVCTVPPPPPPPATRWAEEEAWPDDGAGDSGGYYAESYGAPGDDSVYADDREGYSDGHGSLTPASFLHPSSCMNESYYYASSLWGQRPANGPTPSPEVSRNASFAHNPYPAYVAPSSASLSRRSPSSSSAVLRVHDPYATRTADATPTCDAHPWTTISTPSSSPSSHVAVLSPSEQRMPPRTDTEVFANNEALVANDEAPPRRQGTAESDGAAQRCTNVFKEDGGEQPTLSYPLLSPNPHILSPPHASSSFNNPPGSGSAVQTPAGSLQPSPSLTCQPSLFSQMRPGYDEDDIDLFLLPPTATAHHYNKQHGGGCYAAAHPTPPPHPGTGFLCSPAQPNIATRPGPHHSAGWAAGRSGELASSSDQCSPQLLHQPFGARSPYPTLTPEEELQVKMLW